MLSGRERTCRPTGCPPSLALAQKAAELAGLVPGVSQQRHHQLPAGKFSLPFHQDPPFEHGLSTNSLPLPGKQSPDRVGAFPSTSAGLLGSLKDHPCPLTQQFSSWSGNAGTVANKQAISKHRRPSTGQGRQTLASGQ